MQNKPNDNNNVKKRGDCAVLYPDGYINDIEGEKLEGVCDELLQKGCRKFVIDFSNTDIINSIGISIIIGVIQKVRDKNGAIFLSGLKKVNYDIFNIVGLTKQISVFKDEQEALLWAGGDNKGALM